MIGLRIALNVLRATARATQSLSDGFEGREDTVPMYTWITARDEKVCPACRPFDGEEYNLLEKDTVETDFGVITIGETVHPNCRCPRNSVLRYVREGRAQAYNKEDYFW
jgi:hypothetical protein